MKVLLSPARKYVVGYRPASPAQEPALHEVRVTLLDKKAGKLSGGSRQVVR